MKSIAPSVLGPALIVLILAGCDNLAPRESFQDCVLTKVSTAADQNVANMLREACAKKHQVEMPQSALSNLEGRAGQAMLGFVIHINNRNSDWILTEVEFYVATDPLKQRIPYRHTVNIEPLNKDAFFPSIDDSPKEDNTAYSWGILKAWGVPAEH